MQIVYELPSKKTEIELGLFILPGEVFAVRGKLSKHMFGALVRSNGTYASIQTIAPADIGLITDQISVLPREIKKEVEPVFKKIKKFLKFSSCVLFSISDFDRVVELLEAEHSSAVCINFESIVKDLSTKIGIDNFTPTALYQVKESDEDRPDLSELGWAPKSVTVAFSVSDKRGPRIWEEDGRILVSAKYGDGSYEFLTKDRLFSYSKETRLISAPVSEDSQIRTVLLLSQIAQKSPNTYFMSLSLLERLQYITPEYLENKKREEQVVIEEKMQQVAESMRGFRHQLNLALAADNNPEPGMIYVQDNKAWIKPVYGDVGYARLRNNFNFSYDHGTKSLTNDNNTLLYRGIQFVQDNLQDYKISIEALALYQAIAEQYIADNEVFELSWAIDSNIEFPVPEGLSYREYQKAGIAYSLQRNNVLLGDDMGLGKTIQIIGIANADTSIERVLIVCPASLRTNWLREFNKWKVRDMSVGIAKDEWPNTQVVITSYNLLDKFSNQVRAASWDLFAADECQYIKNPDAIRTVYVMGGVNPKTQADVSKIEARRIVFASGTPFENRPRELFPILNYLASETFPIKGKFLFRYCGPVNNGYGYTFDGASNTEELNEILRKSVMIRRMKADVLGELPPVEHQILYVDELDKFKNEIEANSYALPDSGLLDLRSEMEKLSRIRVNFEDVAKIWHSLGVKKIPYAIEAIETMMQSERKMLVFCHHQDVAKAIHDHFKKISVIMTGATTKDRSDVVAEFQTNEKIRLFVGTIGASGVGHTLTAASIAFFVEMSPVPGRMQQAIDRMNRIGQTSDKLNAYYLFVPGSYDENTVLTFTSKQMNFDAVNNEKLEMQDVAEGELTAAEIENKYDHDSLLLSLSPDQELNSGLVVETINEKNNKETKQKNKKNGSGKTEKIGKTDKHSIVETVKNQKLSHVSVLESVSSRLREVERVAASLSESDLTNIHSAIRVLDGNCDGAIEQDTMGFNACDTRIGKMLARKEELSQLEGFTALEIMYKYMGQLDLYSPLVAENMRTVYERIRKANQKTQ